MPSARDWLDRLPGLVTECLGQWELRVDGVARSGSNSAVLPVLRADGSRAALKVGWPHHEAAHEHLALRAWAGAGAVRLLAADPARWALLLERLDDLDLDSLGVDDSCEALGGLLHTLDGPALPQLDSFSAHLQRLVGDLEEALAGGHHAGRPGPALPRRLLQQGRGIATDLMSGRDVDAQLVHTDLHGRNVLRRPAPREWVAIDPKPMAALPEIAVAPALWNRWQEALDSAYPRRHLNRRLETICAHAGLDADLARACTVVRMLRNALWLMQEPGPARRAEITVCVTVIKAMLPG